MQVFKFFSKLLGRERTTSESAKFIEQLFDEKNQDQTFFDYTLACFQNYDESNRARNDHFSADIEYIIERTTKSLTSPEILKLFPQRVDTYFYIYRRVIEYLDWAKESRDQIKEFERLFYHQLVSTFESTKGCEPNLCATTIDIIKRINIRQHLASIKEIKSFETLNIFFVLCKLSFQASLLIDDRDRLEWIDIFSKINHCTMSLNDIISQYVRYKQGFEHCPLDMTAFIYLIRTLHLPKNDQISSFEVFKNMADSLNFERRLFFHQFHNEFTYGLNKKLYNFIHIASLLQMLSTHDEQLFRIYLTSYASSVNIDMMWAMFYHLSKFGDINEIMRHHLSPILTQRMQTIPIETFKKYFISLKAYLNEIKDENRFGFLNIFEVIFHGFLNRQLTDDQYSHLLLESHLKEFLDIPIELSLTLNLQQAPYLLVIRHLLFKLNKGTLSKAVKIKHSLEKVNRLGQDLQNTNDPADIIQDEWFNDLTFVGPEEWLRIKKYDYQQLCVIQHKSRWVTYIWSRIVHLSLYQSGMTKPNEFLSQLNGWMNNVEHSIYDANDILTIIFVRNVFEIIMAKQMKSVLSLSNMDALLTYILKIRQETPDLINAKLVDDFVAYVKQSITDVLLLNGRSDLLLILYVL